MVLDQSAELELSSADYNIYRQSQYTHTGDSTNVFDYNVIAEETAHTVGVNREHKIFTTAGSNA